MAIKDSIRSVFVTFEKYHIKRFMSWRKKEIFAAEIKNIISRKDEWKKDLSHEQKEAVDKYFVKYYGKKIPYYWHRMYTNYTGNFDEKYFPEILFSTKLEEKLNPYNIAFPLQNKAFCPQWLLRGLEDEGIVLPEMICENARGEYWLQNGEHGDYEKAISALSNAGEVIIKPTVDTMGGRGVRFCIFENGIDKISGKNVREIIITHDEDFIIQKKIRNHESLRKLHPESLNTLRVITFVVKNDVKVAPLSMKIGVGERFVDNAGIFIGIKQNGELYSEGFSKKHINRYRVHPDTQIEFKGYKIEGVEKIVAATKKLHSRLPQLKMLSWDVTYDENCNVAIIEVNTTAQTVWFPQMVTGKSIFGEYTADMLKLIRKGA